MIKFLALAWTLACQDIQDRFAGAMLGSIWLFIWPLVQLFIYIIIFGKLMGARLGIVSHSFAYGFYIAAGLLCWTFFANALSRAARSLVDRRNIIRKVRVNLAVFPAAACMGELLPFVAGFILLFLADLAIGWLPSPAWLALTFLALYTAAILAYGLGLFFACLAAFARDICEAVGIALQMAFWFTPIVYLPSILPNWLAQILWINPVAALVSVFQQCFVLGGVIHWPQICYAFVFAHLALALGLFALRHWQKDLRDVL